MIGQAESVLMEVAKRGPMKSGDKARSLLRLSHRERHWRLWPDAFSTVLSDLLIEIVLCEFSRWAKVSWGASESAA